MRTRAKFLVASIAAVMALYTCAASLSANPNSPPADFERCKAYVRHYEFTKAISCLQELLAKPSVATPEVEIRAWLMDAHLGNNETERGLAEFKALLQASPDYASELHHIVGRRYQEQSKCTLAIGCASRRFRDFRVGTRLW